MEKPVPSDAVPAREPQKVSIKIRRSIVAFPMARRDTTIARAITWLLPWSFATYPGLRRGIGELTSVPWSTVRAYRDGRRRLTGRVARIFSDIIRSRCEAGLSICAELDAVEAAYVDNRSKPQGWRVVRERDGVMRDGRGSFKRKGEGG